MEENLKVKIDLSRPTGNFWIDTGLVVLAEEFGEGEREAEEILQRLLSKLVQKTGNKGFYFDEKTGQLCEYDKENWVYPTNLFIKVSGTSSKKVKIGKNEYPTSPPRFELKLDLGRKIEVCDICGEMAQVTDAKMWMFPFIVDPGKFGNFYSGAKRGMKLCALCALAGLAGYFGWLWKAQGRDSLHFFLFHSELREMERFHELVIKPLNVEGDKSGNIHPAFYGPYIHETTLGLLLELFVHVHQSNRLPEEGRLYLAKLLGVAPPDEVAPSFTLYAVSGDPGKAFNMKILREFTKLQQLYRIYESWLDVIMKKQLDNNSHHRVVEILRQFEAYQGNKRESIWRDRICWAILEFSDPLPYVEQFLYDVRAKEENKRPLIVGSLDLFNKYLLEVLGMDEQFQRILSGFGHSLGEAAQKHNEMGLLYALRNAKNPEDFYRMLNDAQFRLDITVPEALLKIEKGERIAGVPWRRIKTLLSIYSMNAYLRKAKEPSQN